MTHGRHRARRHSRRGVASAAAALTAAGVVAAVVVLAGGQAPSPRPVAAGGAANGPAVEAPRFVPRTDPPAARGVLRAAAAGDRGAAAPEDAAVLLLGDSLAVGIAEPLAWELPGRVLTVEAEEGRRTGTAVTLLSDHVAAAPPVWVVSLGTNDSPEEFGEDAAALLVLAGTERCVLWFDVWRASTHDAVNAELTTLAQDHPNLHLLPWHALSTGHPEWFSYEDVHPSTDGYAARTRLAVDGVERACSPTGG